MYKLPFITILALFIALNILSQSSPHGDKLKTKCDACHISKNWTTIVMKNNAFNHNITSFPLLGQHQSVNCKKFHTDLIFSKANTQCISCHIDIINKQSVMIVNDVILHRPG